jgi:hypothetical protein
MSNARLSATDYYLISLLLLFFLTYFFCIFITALGGTTASLFSWGLCRDKAIKYLLAITNLCLNLVAESVLLATS